MKTLMLIILALGSTTAFAEFNDLFCDRPFFHATDPLAPRDDLGLRHQTSTSVNETEFEHRVPWRFYYNVQSGRQLITSRAYVGALQRDLKRQGFFWGTVDGVFSAEVSDAIARLQKGYSMRVTGTLTIAVRRVLYLT